MLGRGAVGETVLHLCCLAKNHYFAHYLLNRLGKSLCNEEGREVKYVDAVYTGAPESETLSSLTSLWDIGETYAGETALHIAVAQDDLVMVGMLLDAGAEADKPCIRYALYS